MFCMNRFTGEIVHLISEDLRPRLLDIMTGKDVEYFVVDEAIAPILQNLIKKGVITHDSCSGHYNDLSIPYLVLDRWETELIEYVGRRINSDSKFRELYTKYVREISFTTVHMPKRVYEEYNIKGGIKTYPGLIMADIIEEDGNIEAYSLKATGIYLKGYAQYCDESGTDINDHYENMKYIIDLWRWVSSIIDDYFKD